MTIRVFVIKWIIYCFGGHSFQITNVVVGNDVIKYRYTRFIMNDFLFGEIEWVSRLF